MDRRKFLLNTLGLASAAYVGPVFSSCKSNPRINGTISGPDHLFGHRLRDKAITNEITGRGHYEVVVIGGGVSGLSAARYLKRNNVNFILFELEHKSGGNSLSGSNAVSAFPLGAHYLPIPSNYDKELKIFLEEVGVITGYQDNQPIFNEFYLCADPKERLFIHGHWQEGLIPQSGVPSKDRFEINYFHELMEEFKYLKGADGKEAFCIPTEFCSVDPKILELDKISFKEFLVNKGFQSSYLFWYVDYCCADDYGSLSKYTSAWAGIHYFASRKGQAYNEKGDGVLTWPEGNGWLVDKLAEQSKQHISHKSLVYSVKLENNKVVVKVLEGYTDKCIEITADKVILATPQFINHRILDPTLDRGVDVSQFSYAPWMVANAIVNGSLDEKRGEPLCWDNVIYGSNALGYVNANHQDVKRHFDKRVITYYMPMLGSDVGKERKLAQSRSIGEWHQDIIADLKRPHPKIEQVLESLDVWIWGHGMIRPTPGFISGQDRLQAIQTINNVIYFAHSDLSGISIFEEAFNRGTQSAKQAIFG